MIRSWLRSTLVAAGAVAVVAGSAGAQGFNFSTRGMFTSGADSCDDPVALMTVTCIDPSPTSTLSLTFTGRDYSVSDPFGFGNGSTVTLGSFNVAGNGSVLNLPEGAVTFTLFIDQFMPTTNTGSTAGFITGTLSRPTDAPAFSNLVWSPTEIVNIDGVTYDLIFRDAGIEGIVLSASSTTSIEAVGTVVPEPSTYALMATGLAGLLLVARRRRSA